MTRPDTINPRSKKLIIAASIIITLLFIISPIQGSLNPSGSHSAAQTTATVLGKALNSTTSNDVITTPDTTLSSSSNGTYDIGEVGNLHDLNIFTAEGFCDFFLLNEIYQTPAIQLPNLTIIPWLASSYVETNVSSRGIETFDPVTGCEEPVNYIWTVNIRPDVKWSDWTQANANDTYLFSNNTQFVSTCGVAYNHTYRQFYNEVTGTNQTWSPVTMKTYYLQAADFILSWKLLFDSYDYSGEFQNIVNVVPVNNLTVEYYLSNNSATFVDCTMDTPPVIPYNVWSSHDYASTSGLWNYTPGLSASDSYNNWELGYNPATGEIPGLVGNGPFMITGGFGQPAGKWISGDYWQIYANPDFFAGYYSGLSQYMPKISSIEDIFYAEYSSAVAAEQEGKIYSIVLPPPPSFIPTLSAIPDTYIYDKQSTGYNYIQLNSLPSNSPFNITALRQALNYATDKTYIADVIFEGYDIPGQSIVPVSDSIWHDSNVSQYDYNPVMAEKLISGIPGMTNKSGEWYYDGKQVKADIQVASAAEDPSVVEAMDAISTEWSAIGISTTVQEEASSTACANTEDYAYNAITCPITGVVGDPTGFYLELYNTLGNGTGLYLGPFTPIVYNGVSYTGSQITDLMNNLTEKIDIITNLTERLAISDEIQSIAAQESTMINLGYPIKTIPITNSTFTGIVKDNLGIDAFWYWNFLSLHERKLVVPKVVNSSEEQLLVGVISNSRIYGDGQYGNITVEVRNQYGSPVSNANVTVGYSPAGSLLNISSYTGKTNSQGEYDFAFRVSPKNTLIYTSDYMGSLNITASASINSPYVTGGIGFTHIDVQPNPVAYKTTDLPVLGTVKASYFNVTVYNPENGSPISGYSYTLQALSGAVILTNTSSAQSVSTEDDCCHIGIPVNSTCEDFNTTTLTGTTGSNGVISVMLQANDTFNFTLNGQFYKTYIFVGNYVAGAPLTGKESYAVLGELTSSTNSNGFGVAQPFEIPVMITNSSSNIVSVDIQTSNNISYDGQTSVILNVTDNGIPVPDYNLTLTAQNVLGANRGYFPGGLGSAYNPNSFFGSVNMPMINVTTNVSGIATVTFNAGLYSPLIDEITGEVITYSGVPFLSSHLIPYDEFEIGVTGINTSNQTYVVSNQLVFNNSTNPFLYPVANAVMSGENYINGVVTLNSGQQYQLYINTTYDTIAGPNYGNLPVMVKASYGTLSESNATTGSNGSIAMTYTSSAVHYTTLVTITITVLGTHGESNFTYCFYDLPVKKVSETSYYYIIGGLGAITVILAASLAISMTRSRKGKGPKE
jgi:ABC-type transport system substrate-binding protein